jgi:hypothetical protein
MTETKVKKAKKWKYYTSLTFVDVKDKSKHSLFTQLYQIGVYGIWDNDSAQQGNYKPSNMVSIVKKLKALELKGTIEQLEFGREITVTEDENGFYKEVE